MTEENQQELEWPLCKSNDQFNNFKMLTMKLDSMDTANVSKWSLYLQYTFKNNNIIVFQFLWFQFQTHSSYKFQLMKEMRCIPSCTYDKYIVREWYDSNFDMLAYQFGDDQRDGANFEVSIIL